MAKADKASDKVKKKKQKKAKGEGQIAQIIQVFKMTIKYDRKNLFIILAAFLLPVIAGVLFPIITSSNWIGYILWILAGVMTGVLLGLIVMGRRAENAAFKQMEGQEGAVGAAIKNLRKSWQGNEMPVAVNPKSRDAVYRAVGKPGVFLLVESRSSRISRLVNEEKRRVQRVIPNMHVEVVEVGQGEGQVRLHRVSKYLNKQPKVMGKREVAAVYQRLESLTPETPIAIPKGIDPFKVRPQRPR